MAIALFAACGAERYPPRVEPSLSSVHSTGLPIVRAPELDSGDVLNVDLPFPTSPSGRLLLGDVHRRPGTEIVVVDRGGIAVYASGGQLLTHVVAPEPVFASAVLADVDRDARLDIIAGVSGGADPVVRAVNGLGKELVRRRFEADGRSFGAVLPVALVDADVLVVARENWLYGPRGVFRLELPHLVPRWFSAVPTGIESLQTVGRRIAISTETQRNGEYTEIGVNGDTRFGFDATPHLLIVDPHGAPAVERRLGPTEDEADQSLWVLPMLDETIIAHVAGHSHSVYLVDAASGSALAEISEPARVDQIAVLAPPEEPGVVLVRSEGNAWTISLMDGRLTTVDEWHGTGESPRVLALVRSANGAVRPFVALRDRLSVPGDEHAPPIRASAGRTVDSLVTTNESGMLAVVLGERLVLYRTRFR